MEARFYLKKLQLKSSERLIVQVQTGLLKCKNDAKTLVLGGLG